MSNRLGASPVYGELLNKESLVEGCNNCDFVFHLAVSGSFLEMTE